MKEIADFILARCGNTSMWLERSLASPSMIELIADADRLLARPECLIIKDQRKIKVGRVPLEWDGKNAVVYIKRYNAYSLRYRLQSLFACSGAVRSLRGAAILSAIGVLTARPVAAIEQRYGGMLRKSFYVTEEIEAGKTADAYWRENLAHLPARAGAQRRRQFLKELAQLFSRLHGHDVYHNDLKDANILVVPGGESGAGGFYLLDLEGVRRYAQLSRRRRIKNLVQLNRTLGRYLRRTELWYFLHNYLSGAGADRPTKKRWATSVLSRSFRLDWIKDIAKRR